MDCFRLRKPTSEDLVDEDFDPTDYGPSEPPGNGSVNDTNNQDTSNNSRNGPETSDNRRNVLGAVYVLENPRSSMFSSYLTISLTDQELEALIE